MIGRTRARKFPAVVSCTCIDWFQPWPKEALQSVAQRFCQSLPLEDDATLRSSVEEFMPFMFYAVSEAASRYADEERRWATSGVYRLPTHFGRGHCSAGPSGQSLCFRVGFAFAVSRTSLPRPSWRP